MRKIYGVGINDANYPVTKRHRENGKVITDFYCPYYALWEGLLRRVYSPKLVKSRPSYNSVQVCEEWLKFSNFSSWVKDQPQHDPWLLESRQPRKSKIYDFSLDKDFLSFNTKLYSPETCVLIPAKINNLLTDCNLGRGEFPIGVHYSLTKNKFIAQGCVKGIQKYLGQYSTAFEAHQSWQKSKISTLKSEVEEYKVGKYSDLRVVAVLNRVILSIEKDLEEGIETKNVI